MNNITHIDKSLSHIEKPTEISISRWQHWLSGWQANHPGFWTALGKLENRVLSDQLSETTIKQPIYIAGLARSGTTILLELLNQHPQLSSHQYRDFPPVLTPWFWNWFVDRASTVDETARERAHGDGIKITAASPEAFEEVIWMSFFTDLHNPATCSELTTDTSNSAFEGFYRNHIKKILLLRNGNIHRLNYLPKLFPDARFILPVRDPVWHIASLMKQHTHFCREHARDTRLQQHMSRAGHFEFGLDRRPINSGNTAVTRRIREYWANGFELDGWALYWRDVYYHAAELLMTNPALRAATLVIDYQHFCENPVDTVEAIIEHCQLPKEGIQQVKTAANSILHPGYYRPSFSREQIAQIESVTGMVRDHLLTLAVN